MSPLELVKLSEELRSSRPVPSPALRARVAELSRVEPAGPRWTLRLPSRRLVLGLAAAALLGSFVAAGVTGLGGSGEQRSTPQVARAPNLGALTAPQFDRAVEQGRALKSPTPTDLAPTAGRLQRYDATLRLRVKDVEELSNTTRRAMSLTRALGGYVGSIQYSTRGGKRGGALLVLRVPVANVQAALAELSTFGTILQQQASVLDVTRRSDAEAKQIAKLERALATAGPVEAADIRFRLKTLRAKHARLLRSASLAKISLGLTTPAKQAAAAPSRFDRTLDDAGTVLLRELELLLYALVVAGPLLLLGGIGIAAARAQRRRSDARLLERA